MSSLFKLDYNKIKSIDEFKLKDDLSNIEEIVNYYINKNSSIHRHLLIKSVLYENYAHSQFYLGTDLLISHHGTNFKYLMFHDNVGTYLSTLQVTLFNNNLPVIIDIRNLYRNSKVVKKLFSFFVRCGQFRIKGGKIKGFNSNYERKEKEIEYIYLNNSFNNVFIRKNYDSKFITKKKNIYFIVDDYTFKRCTLYESMLLLYLKNVYNVIGEMNEKIGKVYTELDINNEKYYLYNFDIEFVKEL